MEYVVVAVVGLALLAAVLFFRRRTKRFRELRIGLAIVVIATTILFEWFMYEMRGMANFDGYELKIYVH